MDHAVAQPDNNVPTIRSSHSIANSFVLLGEVLEYRFTRVFLSFLAGSPESLDGPRMMHYKKGKNVEEELTREQIPLNDLLPASFLWMHVKGGSRIFGLIDYAKRELESGQYRAMVWSGSGGGVGKTISCAEIMKKDYELHQVTRICYRKVEEFWDPQQEGLEPIVATRNIPSIHILLSLDELDPKTAGYQHSRTRTTFWSDGEADGKAGRKNYFAGPQLKKKPNRHYENEGGAGNSGGANGNGSASASAGGNGGNKGKKKNKNKGGKPAGDGEKGEVKEKKDSGGKGENKAKKAKNNENKQKAQSSSGEASAGKEPPADQQS